MIVDYLQAVFKYPTMKPFNVDLETAKLGLYQARYALKISI